MEVANHLRRAKAPKIVAVNKLDNFEREKTYEFYELGLGEPIPISAEQSKGIGDLLDEIVKYLKKLNPTEEDNDIKIALVGKPNAGKSSITNKLLGEDRVVVSSVAGTTRDAIDSPFKWNNKDYCLIDTAGLRRKSKIEQGSIERYSVIRSLNAIERCDVAVLVIDASQGITEQDVKIAGLIHEQGKPSVIVINKWDLVENAEKSRKEFEKQLKSIKLPITKFNALIKLLRKAIIGYGHVNKVKAIEFDERLRKVVEIYNTRDKLVFTSEVVADFVNDLSDELIKIFKDLEADKTSFEAMGITYEEKAFYDILVKVRDEHGFVFADEKCISLAKEIKRLVDDKVQYADFFNRDDIKNQLNMDLTVLLYKNGYPPEWDEEVFNKVMEQAENFKKYNG